ncbi:hypothetical protein VTN77DRAFT_1845 [Rasamsonia byssochlamydoides]|uniref:uncharacterized protein n=1 Tax=Rasamsonia byssochlamydoides TaxID=89139 RepID=UPI00374387DE
MAKPTKRSEKDKGKSSSSTKPLTPFVKAPSILQPFLEPLSTDEIYLIHIDTHPLSFKKQLLIVPVLLNTAIVLLIAYRVYKGAFVYPALLATALGRTSSMSVDTSVISWNEFWGHILRRTAMFTFDYLLVTLFVGWPIRFVQGPLKWRRAIGFREREVIVRQSRKPWSEKLVRNRWIYDDEKTVREKIMPAVAPERVKKSGFLLIDANWDLDYDAMVRAHRLIDLTRKGEGIQLDEFRTAVLVHTDEDGWLIWRVEDEERNKQRETILAFRRKLASMGKEDLFFRWVELIQFESTQPGGFTPERQRSAMLQAKEMFEAEGVDFSRFWQEVGGMEGNIIDLT